MNSNAQPPYENSTSRHGLTIDGVNHVDEHTIANRIAADTVNAAPILICLLGHFKLQKHGASVNMRRGGKTEALIGYLAIQQHSTPRDILIQHLWPTSEMALASQALHSLVHSLQKLFGDAIAGAPFVVHAEGGYRLNSDAGISVDVAHFDRLALMGDEQFRTGDKIGFLTSYKSAINWYRGDLCAGANADTHGLIESERLRVRHLTILARLADHFYESRDYAACLEYAWKLLSRDPCREDAHRLVMRCHVQSGHRSEALRQYHLCADVLRTEFGVTPEPSTTALFEKIRIDPVGV